MPGGRATDWAGKNSLDFLTKTFYNICVIYACDRTGDPQTAVTVTNGNVIWHTVGPLPGTGCRANFFVKVE